MSLQIWKFGEFDLDQSAGQLLYAGEPIHLPPKVYKCLELLVENAGQIVSKEEFFEKIWEDSFVGDGSLSYTISQLRKTLAGFDSNTQFVETVPGRGFRFCAPVQKELSGTSLVIPGSEALTATERNDDEVLAVLPTTVERRSRNLKIVAAVGVVLAIASLVYFLWRKRTDPRPENTPISLAVLPLKNLGSKADLDESVSVGMTDALITQLGKSDRLIVRPLGSVLSVAAEKPDPIEAGKTLGVDSVIDWNIRKTGSRLRISARLIDVASGKQIWDETFEEAENEIFDLQDSVSERAARSLISGLSAPKLDQLHARSTNNNEAYSAYLRGRYYWNRRDFEGFEKAQELFEAATSLDPKFAEAYAGLADVHLGFYDYGYKKAEDTVPKSLSAARTALKLDPNLADAYSTIASLQFLHDRDWKAAETSYKKAIELAPNNPTTRLRYGWALSVAGRFEEGLKQLRIAEKFDPTSRIGQTNIAYNYLVSDQFARAEAKLKEIRQLHPDFSLVLWYQGSLLNELGRQDEALEEYLKAMAIDSTDAAMTSRILTAKETLGVKKALAVWRGELEAKYRNSYMPPSNIALVAALERDKETTLKWLKEAETIHDPWLLQIVHDPEYRFLKDEPEYQKILNAIHMTPVED
ncbi:MAG: winged helix-turn-helix domain-containing protein [Pyrinomonadaceae bacterium]